MPLVNGKPVDLAAYSVQFRTVELSRNEFSVNNQYVETSPDALSPIGKGEKNNQVGSAADIVARNTELAKNIYTVNNQYDGSKVSA
jgi:hypothetical protein